MTLNHSASMNEQTPPESHRPRTEAIDIAELDTLRNGLREKLFGLGDNEDAMSLPKQEEMRAAMIEDFITGLLSQAERFGRIFTTESGSMYFVTNDGASLRIKAARDDVPQMFRPKPIIKKQVFIDDATARDIFANINEPQKLIGTQIPKQPYGVGVLPLEIGIENYPVMRYEETDETLTILGDEHGENYSGMHIGHRVKDVIR